MGHGELALYLVVNNSRAVALYVGIESRSENRWHSDIGEPQVIFRIGLSISSFSQQPAQLVFVLQVVAVEIGGGDQPVVVLQPADNVFLPGKLIHLQRQLARLLTLFSYFFRPGKV